MAKLLYLTLCSLDGYIEDGDGGFSWAEPSDEVHAFVNDVARSAGTFLYGRRMYEVMTFWEDPELAAQDTVHGDFARVWQAADKVVYSTTIGDELATKRTRLERTFDPEAVRALKTSASADLAIGGAAISVKAFGARLIDECHLFVVPVSVGGGKLALPRGTRVDLDLVDQRRFDNGTVYLRYQVRQPSSDSP